MRRLTRLYGDGPRHLLAVALALALTAYAVSVLGPGELWDGATWWQTIGVWFLGAAVLHDVVVVPVYAGVDRLVAALSRRGGPRLPVPLVNHVRVPLAASALLLAMFFPGILQQGSASYLRATGQTQDPFLERWLLLCAAFFAVSALVYAVRVLRRRRG